MLASRRSITPATLALAAALGCDSLGYREPCPRQTPFLAPPAIQSVPDTLELGARRYLLRAFLWRDFMPGSSRNGEPLRAVVRLSEIDSLAVPDSVGLAHLWAIHGDLFWSTEFNDERIADAKPFELARIARCGPKWDPNVRVNVIVRVRHGASRHDIRLQGALIERTS